MTRKRHPEVPEATTPDKVSRRQLMKGAAGAAAGATAASAVGSAPAGAASRRAGGPIRSVDVAIVGAGISGLYAAYLLSKKPGTSFAVIEARGRTGGRVLNAGIGVGNQVVEAG